MRRTPGLRLACPAQAPESIPHSTPLPFIIRDLHVLAHDIVAFFRLALPLATVLIKRLEDDFSRFAFAGRMFRRYEVTPVVLPTFVRFTSSGRVFADFARVLPFPESKLWRLRAQKR